MRGIDLSPRKTGSRLKKALRKNDTSELMEIIHLLEEREYDDQSLDAIRAFKAALSGEQEYIETVRKILEEIQHRADSQLIDQSKESEKEPGSLIQPWTEFIEIGGQLHGAS